jgi:hypothetical protein
VKGKVHQWCSLLNSQPFFQPMNPAAPSPASSSSAIKAIFWGGALCGTGDLLFAFAFYGSRGATPQGIMQSIAGGLLGTAAREGGASTAALGFLLHYIISFGAATVYYAASRRLHVLIRHAVSSGFVFGAAVYFFMNMVVLPLSARHTRAFPPPLALFPILAHLFLVGLPIALVVRHYSRRQSMAAV